MLFSLILAALVTVSPGETPSGAAAGEIAAVRLVAVGEAPGPTVTATNTILSATVNGITTLSPTNVWWFGGSFLLTPADASAQADIIVK